MFRAFTLNRTRRDKPLFYGWWIVGAGAVSQAYTSGAFWHGFGAFFDPIVTQFGWSRAVTSGVVSLQRTESGMIAPFVGTFIDRFGPRKVMLVGILATGLGFVSLSRVNSLWQFYAAFTLITIGLSFGTFLVVTTCVANWFVAQRGRALSVLFAGSGLGGLMVPLIILLISATDWRTGLLVIGIGFWVMGIPVAFVMKSRPEDYGYFPDGGPPDAGESAGGAGGETGGSSSGEVGARTATRTATEAAFTVRQALRTRTFWQMALALGSGQLIMSASVHQIPALTSFGVSRETAGLVMMGVAIMSLAGRVLSGVLGDMIDKRQVIAGAFVCQLLGTVIFAYTGNVLHLLGFILFWGIGFGASIPLRFALLADYFGRRHFGSIIGIMMTVSTIFGVVGPVFVGWMFDWRGNYRDPYLILSLTLVVSIPLILGVTQPVQRSRSAA